MTKEEILETVTMRQVAESYGVKVNRNNMCCCPFHNDRKPSMKIYKNSFHCFTCQISGDLFKFVEMQEGVSFKEAFIKLGGTYAHTSVNAGIAAEISRKRAKNRREKAERTEKEFLSELCRAITICRLGIQIFEPYSDDWCLCHNKLFEFMYVWENKEEGGVNKLDVLRRCQEFRRYYDIKPGVI